jgi:2-oxoisovalerate dehydrogenase E1 component
MSNMPGETAANHTFEDFKKIVINDYRICYESRQASLLGRKEVLTGKAKFGIFGDGKEVAQVAQAKVFRDGDWRAGYYRDQTFMFATGLSDIRKFFAQLYAHTDTEAEPSSAGRSMNGHFGTRFLDEDGSFKTLSKEKNASSDISPTAGQMARSLGLAYASKLFRNNAALHEFTQFSDKGNEVTFVNIGNASTSEGHFFETFNAAGVLQVPLVVSVWDDDYGISVPAKYQTTKQSISEILKGFQRDEKGAGFDIHIANGWDYAELCNVYAKAAATARKEHVPQLVHVCEMTQPQGHSTSGSHERYKSKERLAWEIENDCIKRMREWMLDSDIATPAFLDELENNSKQEVMSERREAFEAYLAPIRKDIGDFCVLLASLDASAFSGIITELKGIHEPLRKDIGTAISKAQRIAPKNSLLKDFKKAFYKANAERYSSYLYSESQDSALKVKEVKPEYNTESKSIDGYLLMQACFDYHLTNNPLVFAIGEDVGKIGDVNQGFSGMQEKHGEIRVTDTGIRENTIVGQGYGAAQRGLRPIVEIQYLDYLLYALQLMSDDIATLQWRTKGGQKSPLIIRTRGHRLEGVWHSGSPMGMIIHAVRGMHICVPRNMTQAAGMYTTLLQCDEPALLVECLNGYRLKEKLPLNMGEYTVPLGVPEILKEGEDITIISYGSTLRVIQEAMQWLEEDGISCELIDVQTLLPFDIHHSIIDSIRKTNKVVFIDEDVPGGASAYMMQEVLENQEAFRYLDAAPATITSKPHRPAYGTDGDYFSKPNAEEIYDKIKAMMAEYDPGKFNL